jgi:hypothetical protein
MVLYNHLNAKASSVKAFDLVFYREYYPEKI